MNANDLIGKNYKGKKIAHVDYDEQTSSICDLWLITGQRVSFSTLQRAIEFITIDEIINIANGDQS